MSRTHDKLTSLTREVIEKTEHKHEVLPKIKAVSVSCYEISEQSCYIQQLVIVAHNIVPQEEDYNYVCREKHSRN